MRASDLLMIMLILVSAYLFVINMITPSINWALNILSVDPPAASTVGEINE